MTALALRQLGFSPEDKYEHLVETSAKVVFLLN